MRAAVFLLTLAIALGACGSSVEPPAQIFFEPGFQFGTAIAGFQVDMGCPTLAAADCEDRASDWYAYVTSPEIIGDPDTFVAGDPPSTGPGHWELYPEDLRLADESVHTNALRTSIEWSRIFPTATDGVEGYQALAALADPAAVQHYHDLFAALAARGMRPLVTLNHYTLPLWIHDGVACHRDLGGCSPRGWLDRERTVREIAKYAGFVAREFGGEVDGWITENEPFQVIFTGYIQPTADRTNPPAVALAFDEAKAAFVAMVEAHARMVDAIRAEDAVDADGDGAAAQVGLVYAMVPMRPCHPDDPTDVTATDNLFYLYNMAFLNAVAKGDLDDDLDGTAEHRDDLAGRMDFLGLNYYTRVTVTGLPGPIFPGLSPKTTFDPTTLRVWEDYPRGIFEMIEVADRELGLPVIVTENGTENPDDDDHAIQFLVQHLHWVAEARAAQHRILGYYLWTLMDNYEWNHGMGIRMGLYAVDKDDPTKHRTPRRTIVTYREIIDANQVHPDLAASYPLPAPAATDEHGCPYWEPAAAPES